MDYSLPGSSILGIFQARVLEWVAISFSRGSSQPRDQTQVSHIVGRLPSSQGQKSGGAQRKALEVEQEARGKSKCREVLSMDLASFQNWPAPCCAVLCLGARSCPTLATPQTAAHQASLSMGFSRQEDWSGLPCPPPGDLPNPGIKLRSPALQADSLPAELPGKPS